MAAAAAAVVEIGIMGETKTCVSGHVRQQARAGELDACFSVYILNRKATRNSYFEVRRQSYEYNSNWKHNNILLQREVLLKYELHSIINEPGSEPF